MIDSEALDKVLPQTQCGECGYQGCAPYAEAMAKGEADINLCPPGGVKTLKALARLLKKDASAYIAEVEANTRAPAIARIREAECIGCTKCIQACPVDAIIGSNKKMHAVIGDECTGCRLCIEPCPVDCIDMLEVSELTFAKAKAKFRFNAKEQRLKQQQEKKRQHYLQSRQIDAKDDKEAKQAYILAALKRKKSAI